MSKYKIALHKKYFDTGMGITNYFKWVIAYYGLASSNLWLTMMLAVGYAVASYFIGWFWCNSSMLDAENMVANQFNPFTEEVRERLKKLK